MGSPRDIPVSQEWAYISIPAIMSLARRSPMEVLVQCKHRGKSRRYRLGPTVNMAPHSKFKWHTFMVATVHPMLWTNLFLYADLENRSSMAPTGLSSWEKTWKEEVSEMNQSPLCCSWSWACTWYSSSAFSVVYSKSHHPPIPPGPDLVA